MTAESELRIFQVEIIHDPIPGDLGQNACGRDTKAQSVASHECGLLDGETLCGKSIDQGMGGRMPFLLKTLKGTPHRQMGGPENVQLPDFIGACLGYAKENLPVPGQGIEEFKPFLMGEFFGIVQTIQKELLG